MRALALLLMVAGCASPPSFTCHSNAQCGAGGVCAADGCAFADPSCPSGYRYDKSAHARGCVPVTSPPDLAMADDMAATAPDDMAHAPEDFAREVHDLSGVPSIPATSCASGLPKTCGATSNHDCCESPAVAGGVFYRAYDVAGDGLCGTANNRATLSDYRLDRYEITVGRFRAFINAGQGTAAAPPQAGAGAHPRINNSGWDPAWNSLLAPNANSLQTGLKCDPDFATWTDAASANEKQPINCITWYEAAAFCAWDGGFLPTYAESDYAASGGDAQRAYPWSSPAASLALDATQVYYAPDAGTAFPLAAVGVHGAGDGKYGQSDLAGNVSEFVLDFSGTLPTICNDCANLDSSSGLRLYRNGGWRDVTAFRACSSHSWSPKVRSPTIGARCARPL